MGLDCWHAVRSWVWESGKFTNTICPMLVTNPSSCVLRQCLCLHSLWHWKEAWQKQRERKRVARNRNRKAGNAVRLGVSLSALKAAKAIDPNETSRQTNLATPVQLQQMQAMSKDMFREVLEVKDMLTALHGNHNAHSAGATKKAAGSEAFTGAKTPLVSAKSKKHQRK